MDRRRVRNYGTAFWLFSQSLGAYGWDLVFLFLQIGRGMLERLCIMLGFQLEIRTTVLCLCLDRDISHSLIRSPLFRNTAVSDTPKLDYPSFEIQWLRRGLVPLT
jgi:hypothetical protein